MLASLASLGLLGLAATVGATTHESHINYTVVSGIFLQDDPSTDASTFNFTTSNFGLINRTYPSDASRPARKQSTQWQRLAHFIWTLNSHARRNEEYKVLFLGRHGEGYHNAAETYFGTPAWNCYWSELDGNLSVTWADAHLTSAGVDQALAVNRFWKHLLEEEKITAPEAYYTSPLYRCLATANLTFSNLRLPKKNPFVPTIKEYLREGISAHTCDRRSNKTYIHASFPTYRFEKGFPEHDPYWTPLHAEPSSDQDIRSKAVLDDLFLNDKSTYISITSHSGEISSLLRVLGHREFRLSTGAALPVLVKANKSQGHGPTTTTQAFTSVSTCATAPTIRASTCNDCSCCS
ncbi:phosphoglycerate mutase-like protein [Corynespora cassiicola Philippines]|uniref:Phosphoglycerate mutase-like protein n=1 Tax=Corynespora cassiicola Philippines TaxID=1448308 RepID=A0A2T2ND36_CORCC|nr:phosphoglycerate mutase-like protein [Corynespora cassiicola Philippines]